MSALTLHPTASFVASATQSPPSSPSIPHYSVSSVSAAAIAAAGSSHATRSSVYVFAGSSYPARERFPVSIGGFPVCAPYSPSPL